jgi:hypothetical protein
MSITKSKTKLVKKTASCEVQQTKVFLDNAHQKKPPKMAACGLE